MIPSFDDLVIGWLVFFGLPAFVVGLLSLVFSIASYVPPARIALRLIVGTGKLARELTRYRPVQGVLSICVTLAVPIAHVATVVMVYLAANYLTVVFDSQRGDELLLVFNAFPPIESVGTLLDASWYSAAWNAVEPFLELNWFTGGYTLLATVLLVISYFIREDGEVKTVGYILAWPGIIWCAVVVIVLFIYGYKLVDYLWAMLTEPFFQPTGDIGEFLKVAFFILMSGVEWLIYISACHAAVWAPRLIFCHLSTAPRTGDCSSGCGLPSGTVAGSLSST